MKNKSTFAYTCLTKDPKFKQFISDSLRLAQWQNKQSKLKNKFPKKEIVVSLDSSEYITIV